MHNIITVWGNYGSLQVHRASGHIISRTPPGEPGEYHYEDYRWFDPAKWDECALKYGETDILYTAFVCEKGIYTTEMRGSEVVDQHGEWVFSEEVMLLPPPVAYQGHVLSCDWFVDQYPWECTCGGGH
jgi:hypothetical protein